MGTSFIPGPDLSFIGDIGRSIGQIIDPNREQREQVEAFFLQNPEIGQQFALAQREAERQFQADPPQDVGDARVETVVPNVLEQFGFKLDDTQQLLSAFPESPEERLSLAREKAGLPALQVEAEVATLRESIATSNYRQNLAASLDAKGIPELQASQAAAEATLGTKLSDFQKDYLAKWRVHLEQLRESNPFEFRRALAAMNSPEFLRDLQHREELAARGEELNVRARLAEIEAAQGSADRDLKVFGLGLDAQDNLDTQLDRLELALEKGKEDITLLAIDRVNEAAALIRAVSPAGATFAIDPGKRKFLTGRLKGVSFTRLAPGSLSIPLAWQYERLLDDFRKASSGTFESLQQILAVDAEGRAFLGELTPQERSKFWSDARQVFGAFDAAEIAEAGGEDEADAEIERLKAAFARGEIPGLEVIKAIRAKGKPVPAEKQRRMRGR